MRVLTWMFVFVLGYSSVAAAGPATPIADSIKSIAASQVQMAPVIRHGTRRAPTLRALSIGAGVGCGTGVGTMTWFAAGEGSMPLVMPVTIGCLVGGVFGALIGGAMSSK